MIPESMPRSFAVSCTPFNATGQVDFGAFEAHVGRLADQGLGVYVGGSGSGEGTTLTARETAELYQVAASALGGRAVSGAMGIEPRSVSEMVELARMAESAGLDLMQVYSPLAAGATPDELEAYFRETVRQINLPCVISIHHAVGYTVPPAVVGRLLDECPQIVGVNCTHADLTLLDAVDGRVPVWVADLNDVLNNFAWGGHGFLCGEANVAPDWCAGLSAALAAGDFAAAFDLAARLVRLRDGVTSRWGVRGLKVALEAMGHTGRVVRSPRSALVDAEAAPIIRTLEQLGLVGRDG